MRYSLVSRFRGTLVGASVAQGIAVKHVVSQSEIEFSNAVIASCEILIKSGKFNFEDWLILQHEFALYQSTSQLLQTAIFTTLPLALFFHENPSKLRHHLLEIARMWQDDLIVRDSIIAISYAVARSLTEKLIPTTLIPQIVSFIGETTTYVPQNLLKVNALLEQRSSLQQVKNELGKQETVSNLVAIGFYCFLTTLEDFRLSVLLAHQNGECSQIVSAIAGALSGAYNSTAGISIPSLVQYSQKSAQSMPNNFSRMVKSVDGLFAAWSGLYELEANGGESPLLDEKLALRETANPLYVHASPRVIKFR